MCRLLGIVSNKSTEPEIFESFRQQCITGCVKPSHKEPGHMDGWGLSFLKDGRMEVVKGGKDARSDKLYEETYELILDSKVIMGHIRKATDTRTKGVAEFAHPFAKEGWVFAHNGSVSWKEKVKSRFGNLIDSQIVLEVILNKIRGASDIYRKIREVIEEIVEKEKLSALNFLLTNGKIFICYRFFDNSDPENERYYTLYKKMEKERILIASEPLTENRGKWELMAPGELFLVEPGLKVKSEIMNFSSSRK
jgi:predicted glutamine amidotransferase